MQEAFANGYWEEMAAFMQSLFNSTFKTNGFVLGLLAELKDGYSISSNGESGYGRYDIMPEPRKDDLDALLIEFKAADARHGETLEACVESALKQIEEMRYETVLWKKGIPAERIHRYGFAFEGKTVLIG